MSLWMLHLGCATGLLPYKITPILLSFDYLWLRNELFKHIYLINSTTEMMKSFRGIIVVCVNGHVFSIILFLCVASNSTVL